MGKAFTEISAGLNEAIDHAKGKLSHVVKHEIKAINVKAIREKTGMNLRHELVVFPCRN